MVLPGCHTPRRGLPMPHLLATPPSSSPEPKPRKDAAQRSKLLSLVDHGPNITDESVTDMLSSPPQTANPRQAKTMIIECPACGNNRDKDKRACSADCTLVCNCSKETGHARGACKGDDVGFIFVSRKKRGKQLEFFHKCRPCREGKCLHQVRSLIVDAQSFWHTSR